MAISYVELLLCTIGGILLVVQNTHGSPVKRSVNPVNYMKQFGWMPPHNPEASELITEMEMRRSIAQMQRFFRLPETGQLDDSTMALMQKPRCGVPDVNLQTNRFRPNRYAIDPRLKWDKYELTYSFENYTPDMRQADIRDSIESALRVWSDVTPLKFREISREGIADLEIMFRAREHGDGYTFDGQGGTLAHAFFPGIGIGGDAHFDDDETFLYNTDVNGIDLFTVAAHELGHSLGLGHSEEPTALMAPFYQGYDPNFQLHYDDIVGVQMLYGSNPRPPPDRPGVDSVTEAPAVPVTTAPSAPKEDPVCNIKFDAIATIRGELFLFKGDEMWRVKNDGSPYEGYPIKINLFWKAAPVDITAVFEKRDGLIVFVKGNEYWEFNGLNPTHNYPKSITDFGLPSSISVDAAVPWYQESKIFFFFESQVWRYDEQTRLIDDGFPMPIKKYWGDIGNNLAAAFKFRDNTYFVKSKRFWQYDESAKQVSPGYPKYFAVEWLGCNTPADDEERTDTADGAEGSSGSRTYRSNCLTIVIAAIFLCIKSIVL